MTKTFQLKAASRYTKRKVNANFLEDMKRGTPIRAPYEVAIQHIAGSRCVACNKELNEPDMYRRGPASGVELCLCGNCTRHSLGQGYHREDDEDDDGDMPLNLYNNTDFDPNY